MRLPAGVRDWLPGELARKREIEQKIRSIFTRWKYREVLTPGFERFDVLESGLGEALTEETFRFTDRQANALALRPEMTTPIARLVSTRMRDEPLPLRLSYVAPAYRYEEPQEGRMREFTQAGVELIGSSGDDADAEALFMAVETLNEVGLGDACFDINDAHVVDGVLESAGVPASERSRCKAWIAQRNVVALAAYGERIVEFALLRGGREALERVRPMCVTPASQAGLARLERLLSRAAELGIESRINVDFALLRDLEYYTGLVFEGYVEELGFSLCGGGRYDGLLPRFGFDVPAIGWTCGIERILTALERRGSRLDGRLTIAVPKGALFDDAALRLRASGIEVPDDAGRRLAVSSSDGRTELLFLRPSDVPAYVEFGAADCGIVGKDVLWETDRQVCELADLGFGACRLVVAARRESGYHEGTSLPTFLRVATKYARSAELFFSERDLPVEIIALHGSVELAPVVRLADLIVDLTQTGNTLREHDLVIVNEIGRSTARFVANPIRFRAKYDRMRDLLGRLQSVASAPA